MAEEARREIRVVLNDAIAFVTSQARAEEITNRSLEQFINQQLERLEGVEDQEDPEGSSGVLRRIFAVPTPVAQRGAVQDIKRIREGLDQIANSIINNPGLMID